MGKAVKELMCQYPFGFNPYFYRDFLIKKYGYGSVNTLSGLIPISTPNVTSIKLTEGWCQYPYEFNPYFYETFGYKGMDDCECQYPFGFNPYFYQK